MSASDASQPFDPTSQEMVLLIHGTFANKPAKSGGDDSPRWWEAGGDVWEKINQQLPEQFHIAADRRTEVFSWSGDNSERDRRASGRALFQYLQKLEFTNTRYHLVGHSHGGSVIWHCLQESVRWRLRDRRRQSRAELSLPGLRSWCTIGTPFLQLRSLGMASRVSPWFWLLILACAMVALTSLLMAFEDLRPETQQAGSVSRSGSTLTGGEFDEFSFGFEEPADDDYEPLAATFENHVTMAVGGVIFALAAFIALVMWAWASAVKLEASVVREEARIRNQAFVDFGARWLGIWSRHDEAINGLRASLRLGGNIAPRIEISGVTVFDYDRRMRTYRFLARWFIAPLFNLLISRPSDSIIWRSVSRGMQGNDRPGCQVSDISPGPIVPRSIEWEQLPEGYDERLVNQSNEHLIARSKTLLPQLREVLSQLAWTRPEQLSLLLSNETTFEGNELVHTSYFHEPAILDLIACHILRHNRVKAPRANSKSSTSRWCRKFRHKARDLARDPSLHAAALPLLGQRNYRAVLALLAVFVLITGPLCLELLEFSPPWPWDWTWVAAIAVTLLSWTSIRRVKRGARLSRTARWSWNLSRMTLLAYAVIAVVA